MSILYIIIGALLFVSGIVWCVHEIIHNIMRNDK